MWTAVFEKSSSQWVSKNYCLRQEHVVTTYTEYITRCRRLTIKLVNFAEPKISDELYGPLSLLPEGSESVLEEYFSDKVVDDSLFDDSGEKENNTC